MKAILHLALEVLSSATGELVHRGVLSGMQIVYVDQVEPGRAVRVWSAAGRKKAAVRTALGRTLLTFRGTGREILNTYVADASGGVGEIPVDVDHVWRTLETARIRGYATESQENEPDISCVAVPLIRDGLAIAAVSITSPAEQMSQERVQWLHAEILKVLSSRLPDGLKLP